MVASESGQPGSGALGIERLGEKAFFFVFFPFYLKKRLVAGTGIHSQRSTNPIKKLFRYFLFSISLLRTLVMVMGNKRIRCTVPCWA